MLFKLQCSDLFTSFKISYKQTIKFIGVILCTYRRMKREAKQMKVYQIMHILIKVLQNFTVVTKTYTLYSRRKLLFCSNSGDLLFRTVTEDYEIHTHEKTLLL